MVHRPVMLDEVLRNLAPKPDDVIVDCTIGEGGHAEAICRAISPSGRLIGIDQDEEALRRASERLKGFNDLYSLIWDNFQNLGGILDRLNVVKINGALFDLGVSSLQLGEPSRGFSFLHDAPLDMRMDRRGKVSAFDLVNHLTQDEITRILRDFGQERWSNRIARHIVRARKHGPIVTTSRLANIVRDTVPSRYRYGRIHPATRTFQAFRIAVNRELESLEVGLACAIDALSPGGRICAISFHSLEDKVVKSQFKRFSKKGILEIITKKPILPKDHEIKINPRCRSGKLRVAAKI